MVEETYELPEEDVSFSLADRLGDQLSELKVEEHSVEIVLTGSRSFL